MSMASPPAYQASAPPAGLRVPTSSSSPFPSKELTGSAPLKDLDGSPVYIASALIGTMSVQPCKVVGSGRCMVGYGGQEVLHQGRYDILPITEEMEWVPTSGGRAPKGRRLVEGGFEQDGAHLYHALVTIKGLKVPGKAGQHLGGANVPWNGGEHVERNQYEVLCWRN